MALHDGERVPDLALLQHAANIAALEVERINAEREHGLRLGSELLAAMLERRIEPASAAQQLEEQGIAPEGAVLVAFRPTASAANHHNLHHELAQRELPHLVLWSPRALPCRRCPIRSRPDRRSAERWVRAWRWVSATRYAVADRAPDAGREARWAQTAAHTLAQPLARYGEATPLFLPRTLGEAESAPPIACWGRLLAYDEAHGTELLHSLSVFLEENRAWQRSAELLHVHKQTLVYRMHRVEELTGRDLRSTGDIVELWMALRALEFSRAELSPASAGTS